MQIVFHIGVHCTDEDRLLKTLLRNRDRLLKQGVSVPGPSRYRPIIRETLQKLRGQPAGPEAQDVLLDAILEEDEAERLILSSEQFLGVYARVHGNNLLYPQAGERLRALRGLFPDHEVEFHFALRDLATFFPAVFNASQVATFQDFMGQCDLRKFSWAHMVARMRQAVPDAPFVCWANEDTPMIWPEVLETVAAHSPETILEGREDMLREVLTEPGLTRLRAYMDKNPPEDPVTYARIVGVFLDKYLDEDKIEEEIELPGWTDRVIDYLSEAYEKDLETVASLPGVDMITG